jgi:hypothetical protein
MSKIIIYNIGGFCSDCSPTHDHPLNNIVEQYEVEDSEPTPEEVAKASALVKLSALGLTEEEVKALLG